MRKSCATPGWTMKFWWKTNLSSVKTSSWNAKTRHWSGSYSSCVRKMQLCKEKSDRNARKLRGRANSPRSEEPCKRSRQKNRNGRPISMITAASRSLPSNWITRPFLSRQSIRIFMRFSKNTAPSFSEGTKHGISSSGKRCRSCTWSAGPCTVSPLKSFKTRNMC